MQIVSDSVNSESIEWISHGKAFVIKDREKFASEVLPRYFSAGTKYTSFTRRLNRWKFKCYSRSPGSCVFHHPDFLRDEPDKCRLMKGCGNNSKAIIEKLKKPLQHHQTFIRERNSSSKLTRIFSEENYRFPPGFDTLHSPIAQRLADINRLVVEESLKRQALLNNIGLMMEAQNTNPLIHSPLALNNLLAPNLLRPEYYPHPRPTSTMVQQQSRYHNSIMQSAYRALEQSRFR